MTEARGSADPGAGRGWRWDVALSYAGAQRDYVGQVAQVLEAQGVRCFYDADKQIELWGKYLAEELPAIYGEQAAVVVVFVSAEYAAGAWTRLELRAALGRAVRERRECVLPGRFDDTPLPGLLSDMVTVDLRGRAPEQFAAMIVGKLVGIADAAPTRLTEKRNHKDFWDLVEELRIAEKKRLQAAAAVAKARREQIRELLDRARELAARTAAVTQPDLTLQILRTEESPPQRRQRWFRGIYAWEFRGWAVFRWSGQSRTGTGGSAIHCSVLLTTTGDLVAFTHDRYEPRRWRAQVRDSKDTLNKISDIGDGRLLPRIFADDVTATDIKEGMARFAARRLPA